MRNWKWTVCAPSTVHVIFCWLSPWQVTAENVTFRPMRVLYGNVMWAIIKKYALIICRIYDCIGVIASVVLDNGNLMQVLVMWLLKDIYLALCISVLHHVNPCPAEPECTLTLQTVYMPTDLDLHCLPLCMWIYSNNLDQVIWLAKN